MIVTSCILLYFLLVHDISLPTKDSLVFPVLFVLDIVVVVVFHSN